MFASQQEGHKQPGQTKHDTTPTTTHNPIKNIASSLHQPENKRDKPESPKMKWQLKQEENNRKTNLSVRRYGNGESRGLNFIGMGYQHRKRKKSREREVNREREILKMKRDSTNSYIGKRRGHND